MTSRKKQSLSGDFIDEAIISRQHWRDVGNYEEADKIRDLLAEYGYEIRDGKSTITVIKNEKETNRQ